MRLENPQEYLALTSYPPKRKSYVLSTSVLDSFSFDFWMLCNGFKIQNHAAIHQPKRAV